MYVSIVYYDKHTYNAQFRWRVAIFNRCTLNWYLLLRREKVCRWPFLRRMLLCCLCFGCESENFNPPPSTSRHVEKHFTKSSFLAIKSSKNSSLHVIGKGGLNLHILNFKENTAQDFSYLDSYHKIPAKFLIYISNYDSMWLLIRQRCFLRRSVRSKFI
jgi:hypothetical protein